MGAVFTTLWGWIQAGIDVATAVVNSIWKSLQELVNEAAKIIHTILEKTGASLKYHKTRTWKVEGEVETETIKEDLAIEVNINNSLGKKVPVNSGEKADEEKCAYINKLDEAEQVCNEASHFLGTLKAIMNEDLEHGDQQGTTKKVAECMEKAENEGFIPRLRKMAGAGASLSF